MFIRRLLPMLLAAVVLVGCASEMKRGSARTLYTIAGTLEVGRGDIGKDIQLTRDQQLLFKMDQTSAPSGKWEMVDYDNRTLLLLSETPRLESGFWGVLLQARALGQGAVRLRFTPDDESIAPREVTFEIQIRH